MKVLTPQRGTEAVPACGPPKEMKFLTCLEKDELFVIQKCIFTKYFQNVM
jgi:hypothetical protein